VALIFLILLLIALNHTSQGQVFDLEFLELHLLVVSCPDLLNMPRCGFGHVDVFPLSDQAPDGSGRHSDLGPLLLLGVLAC